MPSFKPETCEDVEDDEDEAPPAFDAGKIFIFEIEQNKKPEREKFANCLDFLRVSVSFTLRVTGSNKLTWNQNKQTIIFQLNEITQTHIPIGTPQKCHRLFTTHKLQKTHSHHSHTQT